MAEKRLIDQSGLLQGASWIWYPGGKPSVGAPIGTRYFRRTVSLSGDRRVRRAQLFLGADDSFVAHVNGRPVGGGQGWAEVKIFDVTGQIREGLNIVAVAATNSASPTVGPEKNPAGLIGLLKIEFDAGEPLLVPTDARWRAGGTEIAGWDKEAFDDSRWQESQQSGVLGAAPWGKIGGSNHRRLPARMVRHDFKVKQEVRRATAYVCGLGFFDLHVNGRLIGDQLMNPALTGYDRRALLRHVRPDARRPSRRQRGRRRFGQRPLLCSPRDIPVPMTTYGFPKLLFQLRLEYQRRLGGKRGQRRRLAADDEWPHSIQQ